ncbi:Hypothetical protein IALB_2020 [Ignavibacterium album JCM 16511]|uniref:DUF72 domain-containing protein n=1 Tax=Ignavibacterium album (strain DSM 19864 / JCM 16511 / NBRC 101810 / Mat9-16) TaxID=945713 RepID=I0AL68_IGNAJ|nr:DUF72 domain-containing protein [Ignavibacterium album]AFH49725.1 Hypothetical protein IALB_2020 [Ignavibacterium album JCM 16511]
MSVKYYIGTAGWSYKDWVPNFYPKNQSGGFDWLQFYSHYFNCVEVNSTYYTYISPKIVEGWIKKVENADEFIFHIKLHQDFTHKRKFDEQNIKAVRYNLDLLKKSERLGGLLVQFPYSFSFDGASVQQIQKIKDIFSDISCFVEVRHSSWRNKRALEFFGQNDLTLCTIDQPQIGQTIPFEPIVTNNKAYIRFHGRNVEAWKKSLSNFGKEQTYEQQSSRYSYLYSPGELVEIAQKIKAIENKVKEINVIMNNHPKGNAVANAFELIHLLEQKDRVQMPNTIVKAYPRLEEILVN